MKRQVVLLVLIILWSITMEAKHPPYLYKILSSRNWQATQSRKVFRLPAEDQKFIHFSTEDQLDRIIEKHWADAPDFAILKIDTSKLVGDLFYETNPGRETKYYHLYNGSIPFQAILEAKIVYRETSDEGASSASNV